MATRKRKVVETSSIGEEDAEQIEDNLRNAWSRYERGEHVSDEEIKAMIREAESALPYLLNRVGYRVALTSTVHDINVLRGFLEERQDPMWK